jgi:uncharacterized protein
MLSIPREVARRLGYYVYLYVDPRSNRPFYVGKGCGERVLAHLSATGDTRKAQVLNELRVAGLEPRLEILAHGLADEETALRIEAAVIDLCGLGDLTNEVRGWRSIQLAAKPVTVTHPALLIRINRLYRHGMAEHELYEATRGVWKLGSRRDGATYVLAVFEGVARQVYEIESWHRAGTTPYQTRTQESVDRPDRWEFTGHVASEELRSRYVGSSVAAYFPKGLQSPVVYVNC